MFEGPQNAITLSTAIRRLSTPAPPGSSRFAAANRGTPMAYNPFNIFRRNQKVIFAVLTVFIMFMFTLSSGVVGGDFFETFTQWLGSKGKRGDAAATIDG